MSLLLDALNRASKDKSAAEAAAQPKATAEWPSISLTALPNESTPSEPSLTLEQPAPASRAAMQAPSQFPTLGLSPYWQTCPAMPWLPRPTQLFRAVLSSQRWTRSPCSRPWGLALTRCRQQRNPSLHLPKQQRLSRRQNPLRRQWQKQHPRRQLNRRQPIARPNPAR